MPSRFVLFGCKVDAYLQNNYFIAKPSKLISYNKAIGLDGTVPTFLKRWGGGYSPPASYASVGALSLATLPLSTPPEWLGWSLIIADLYCRPCASHEAWHRLSCFESEFYALVCMCAA